MNPCSASLFFLLIPHYGNQYLARVTFKSFEIKGTPLPSDAHQHKNAKSITERISFLLLTFKQPEITRGRSNQRQHRRVGYSEQ